MHPDIICLSQHVSLDKVFHYLPQKEGLIFFNSCLEKGTGRYNILAFDPDLTFISKGENVIVRDRKTINKFKSKNILAELDKYLQKYYFSKSFQSVLPITGGAMGYISYEFSQQLEKLSVHVNDDLNLPDIYLGFYSNLLVEDLLENKTYIVSTDQKFYTDIQFLINEISVLPDPVLKKSFDDDLSKFKSNFTKSEYLKALQKIKDYLTQGEVYQVCLTQRLNKSCGIDGKLLFERLFHLNPAPFSSYLNCGDFEIISTSPERFMQVKNGIIETCPIKGTKKRGKTKEEDLKLKNELIKSVKENAELTMIVDLERNDIGKICKFGSVKVLKHREIKSYPTVWQAVSTIQGELREGINHVDIIRATFPSGSITGTPKIRAMQSMDSSIVIRSIVLKDQMAYIGVGGGIVMDSDFEDEYDETLLKALASLQVIV